MLEAYFAADDSGWKLRFGALTTLPDLMQEEHTLIFLTEPFNCALTVCRFGNHLVLVLLLE